MRYDFSIAKLVNVPSMACAFEERGACAWRAMCSDSDGEDEEVAYMIDIDHSSIVRGPHRTRVHLCIASRTRLMPNHHELSVLDDENDLEQG